MSGDRRRGGWSVVRLAVAVVVAAAVVTVLFLWVFPWIERNLANPTVGGGAATPAVRVA